MLFGKLPGHGDFVARGMSDEARLWWDEQLSLAVARAMQYHSSDFAARYDGAAPWCFHIRHGMTMLTGAIATSADRVGRRFPLVLAGDENIDAAACATTVQAARFSNWKAEEVLDALAGAIGGEGMPMPRGWWPSDAPSPATAPIVSDSPVEALLAMLATVTT